MPDSRLILIAVGDGVLADSLRFSLELEGFAVKLCDESSLFAALRARAAPGCIVLDQDVFARLAGKGGASPFAGIGIPVVLMVGHKTERLQAYAASAGVTKMVEKPLLGGVLFEAIRHALDGTERSGQAMPPT